MKLSTFYGYKRSKRSFRRETSNLSKAFSALRKQGYFARQNFMCCQSCAWAEIPDEKAKKAVFYHKQDNDDAKAGRPFYLAWSGDGNEIVEILKQNGVETEWGGGETTRIKVTNF